MKHFEEIGQEGAITKRTTHFSLNICLQAIIYREILLIIHEESNVICQKPLGSILSKTIEITKTLSF